jgi:uncharacterized protein (DUF2252 family)
MDMAASARDPIGILKAQAATRLPELLPLRYERMRASPFAFLRGAAAIMAADLAARVPSTGLVPAVQPPAVQPPAVQLCGDAHLANFGCYASPEGSPIFDVNDFDETLPGPFDWDVKRLAASLVVSGREQGLSQTRCRALAARSARQYRRHMRRLAGLPPLDAWLSSIDMRAAIDAIDHHKLRRRLHHRLRHATDASLDHYDLVGSKSGRPVIREDAAGRTRHLPAYAATIEAAFAAYLGNLPPPFSELAQRYRLVDSAFKVVGVGSVGTFCAIGLFASENGAPLMLQLKEAQPSALAAATGAPPATGPEGRRVVIGQRRLQAQSDVFLGWTPTPIDGRCFYVRRLKDTRLARIGATIEADMLPFTAALCGRALARAHGRTGMARQLSAAMDDAFDRDVADFAEAYAGQTEADHAAFCQALDSGGLAVPATPATGPA